MRKILSLFLFMVSTIFTNAYSDAVVGNAYFVGVNPSFQATLLVTDLEGNIKKEVLLSASVDSRAQGVAVSSENIYISGTSDQNYLLWITDLGGNILRTIVLGETPSISQSSAFVTLLQNRVYIAGDAVFPQSTLWLADLQGNIIDKVVISSPSNLTAFLDGIAASSSQIGITKERALLITSLDGTDVKTIPIPGESGGVNARGVQITPTQIYVNGSDNSAACIWKVNLDGSQLQNMRSLPGNACFTMALTTQGMYSVSADNSVSVQFLSFSNYSGTEVKSVELPTTVEVQSLALSPSRIYMGGTDGFYITDLEGSVITTKDLSGYSFSKVALFLTSPQAILNSYSNLVPLRGI